MRQVCLDANIWIKVLTEEPDSLRAHRLVQQLFKERYEIIAPSIMKMEVGSILRKKWSRKLLSTHHLHELWRKFGSLPIHFYDRPKMYERAWEIAEQNQLVYLYDAVYLALCDDIVFWTADERLVRSVTESSAQLMLLSQWGA